MRGLSLANNGIKQDGIYRFARCLKHNKYLAFLDLSDNDIGDSAARALSEFLCGNRSVTEFLARRCKISPSGGAAIFRGIRFNRTLRRIDLSDNQIENKGLFSLASTISTNQSLVSVNISGSKAQITAYEMILGALKSNHTLGEMNLRNLKIFEDAEDRQLKKDIKLKLRANRGFARMRRSNPKMKYIHYCAMVGDKQGADIELRNDDSLKYPPAFPFSFSVI